MTKSIQQPLRQPLPRTLKAANELILQFYESTEAKNMQIEAADQHIQKLEEALVSIRELKAVADSVIVDMHTHIQQLKTLLVRYLS